jgi:hypothetical protein
VTDSKSGQDVTAKVLTQIILDLDAPKLDIFSVPMLHRLIRANETIVQDFIDKYLNQAVTAFLDSQRQFEAVWRQSIGLPTGMPPGTDWMRSMMGPFVNPFWGAGAAGGLPKPASGPSGAGGDGGGGEVGEGAGAAGPPEEVEEQTRLRTEVAELKSQVAALREALTEKRRKK